MQQMDCRQGSPPALLDLAHFSRQTAGDLALQRELLALFEQQSLELVARLRDLSREHGTAAPPIFGTLAHRFKGSALAIGAFALADAVETTEQAFANGRTTDTETAFAALAAALAEALTAIDSYIARLDASSAMASKGGGAPALD